jgi:phosphate transport system substrate-binding protein
VWKMGGFNEVIYSGHERYLILQGGKLKRSIWLLVPLAIIIVLTMTIVGCGESATTTTSSNPATTSATTTQPTSSRLSGTITEAGSTTVQPVAEKLANAFMEKYPDITVVIQGGGSSTGVKAAAEGTVDIGAASRDLKENEIGTVVERLLARDGIAIVVHPSRTVSNLTTGQIRQIFSGEITKWSDVGGSDATINVVAREEGSGTRAAFEEMVMGESLVAALAILQPSNGAVRTTVSGDPDSIGFLSFGYVDDTTKALSIDGVAGTVENAKNGTYPIVRPLLFLIKDEPEGIVKEFIDFCLGSEGQEIVAEEYISVN